MGVAAMLLLAVLAGVSGCPTRTRTVDPVDEGPPPRTRPQYPARRGDPIPVAVLPLGLTAQAAARYPRLTERQVGFGVHNAIVDALYETGWFRFVEEKPEVVEDVLQRQWLASSGAVAAEGALELGRLLGARYVIYGEVYGFATSGAGDRGETSVELQLRMIDVETAEYVPASARGTATGALADGVSAGSADFAASTVGQATVRALDAAVPTLLERFSQKLEKDNQ